MAASFPNDPLYFRGPSASQQRHARLDAVRGEQEKPPSWPTCFGSFSVCSGAIIFTLGALVAVAQLILSITVVGAVVTVIWILVDVFLIPGWVRMQNSLLAVQRGA